MSEVKQFELGTILTITTGYNCVDNFDKVWHLVWFVCDDRNYCIEPGETLKLA